MKHVITTLRTASLDQFKIYVDSSDIQSTNIEVTELPFYQQLAHVLVSGEDLELNFKTHYMLDDAERYTKAKLHLDTPSTSQVTDFIKEYCNLVAGKAKAFFEQENLVVGQSLPYAIQGYNEMFYPKSNGQSMIQAWRIDGPHGAIRCSCTLRIFKNSAEQALAKVTYDEQFGQETGSIELF